MASFFPLGAGTGNTREPSTTTHPQQHQTTSTNEAINPWGNPSVVLYRNEEIYQKGFEIWQQYVQVHHHHHTPAATASVYNLGGSSVSGLGPTTRSMMSYSTSSRGMRSGSAGGGINCQDCGNQAKKDCAHLRCRTCCKSRGLECATHVKSTWVPAAKRRERLQQLASMQQQGNYNPKQSEILTTKMLQREEVVKGGGGGGGEKRFRESGGGLVTMNRLAATSSSTGLEMGQNLPAEVTSPALFKCVRVTSIDDSDEHLAYQTAVSIAGRVFKGILYNQGPENRYNSVSADESPRGGGSLPQHNLLTGIGIKSAEEPVVEASVAGGSGLQLNGAGAAAGTFSTPINAFLAGTQFFPPPRS